MNNYTVYIHENKINQKKYIGLTRQNPEKRWREGKGYKTQKKFFNAILKYGWSNFNHIIYATNLSEKEASALEKELIMKFNSINNGYNVDLGGSTTNHSKETIQKIAEKHRGKKLSKECIEEMRKRNSKPVICLETNKEYNSLFEAQQKTGIDKSSIGKVCSGKMNSAGGFHWYFKGDKPIIKADKRYRPVECITTGKKYLSLAEAAKDTNSDVSNIKKVCDGKYKTTNKLKWKYITIEEYYR